MGYQRIKTTSRVDSGGASGLIKVQALEPAVVLSVGFFYALSASIHPGVDASPIGPTTDRAANPVIVPMLDGCGA